MQARFAEEGYEKMGAVQRYFAEGIREEYAEGQLDAQVSEEAQDVELCERASTKLTQKTRHDRSRACCKRCGNSPSAASLRLERRALRCLTLGSQSPVSALPCPPLPHFAGSLPRPLVHIPPRSENSAHNNVFINGALA